MPQTITPRELEILRQAGKQIDLIDVRFPVEFRDVHVGFWVHPYWIGLAVFVGAGLMLAGITDTCGMAMLLARMPWNRVNTEGSITPNSSAGCCNG